MVCLFFFQLWLTSLRVEMTSTVMKMLHKLSGFVCCIDTITRTAKRLGRNSLATFMVIYSLFEILKYWGRRRCGDLSKVCIVFMGRELYLYSSSPHPAGV